MKKTNFIRLGLCLTMMVSVGCDSKTYDEILVETNHPTYQKNIKPMIAANCNSCHSAENGQQPYLETYDQVKEAIVNGNLIEEIEKPSGQGMPAIGRLHQSKINLIHLWITNGFVNQ